MGRDHHPTCNCFHRQTRGCSLTFARLDPKLKCPRDRMYCLKRLLLGQTGMLRAFKHAVAPAASIGYPGNSKQGPFCNCRCRPHCAPFVKSAAVCFALPPPLWPHLLPLLFLSFQKRAPGSDARAHLQSLGVISRGVLPLLLTGDYWAVLVKRTRHNSNHFPTFFRGCTRCTGTVSVSPFRWNLEEMPSREVTHLTPV